MKAKNLGALIVLFEFEKKNVQTRKSVLVGINN